MPVSTVKHVDFHRNLHHKRLLIKKVIRGSSHAAEIEETISELLSCSVTMSIHVMWMNKTCSYENRRACVCVWERECVSGTQHSSGTHSPSASVRFRRALMPLPLWKHTQSRTHARTRAHTHTHTNNIQS